MIDLTDASRTAKWMMFGFVVLITIGVAIWISKDLTERADPKYDKNLEAAGTQSGPGKALFESAMAAAAGDDNAPTKEDMEQFANDPDVQGAMAALKDMQNIMKEQQKKNAPRVPDDGRDWSKNTSDQDLEGAPMGDEGDESDPEMDTRKASVDELWRNFADAQLLVDAWAEESKTAEFILNNAGGIEARDQYILALKAEIENRKMLENLYLTSCEEMRHWLMPLTY
jgi:hypothetical protein